VDGMVEWWGKAGNGRMGKKDGPTLHYSNIPIRHYCGISSFQYPNIPMVFGFHYSTIPLFQLLLSEALIRNSFGGAK
jgi:hypothetical protein